MNQDHENSHFSLTSVNQFHVEVSFVLPMYGMLQVRTCLEFPALKGAENC